jgi:hypothetical protein
MLPMVCSSSVRCASLVRCGARLHTPDREVVGWDTAGGCDGADAAHDIPVAAFTGEHDHWAWCFDLDGAEPGCVRCDRDGEVERIPCLARFRFGAVHAVVTGWPDPADQPAARSTRIDSGGEISEPAHGQGRGHTVRVRRHHGATRFFIDDGPRVVTGHRVHPPSGATVSSAPSWDVRCAWSIRRSHPTRSRRNRCSTSRASGRRDHGRCTGTSVPWGTLALVISGEATFGRLFSSVLIRSPF